MEYLHTMIRVTDLDQSLDFFCNKLGLVEIRRSRNEKGRYYPGLSRCVRRCRAGAREARALVELTYNWDPRPIRGAAISAISPSRSTTSTRLARG